MKYHQNADESHRTRIKLKPNVSIIFFIQHGEIIVISIVDISFHSNVDPVFRAL